MGDASPAFFCCEQASGLLLPPPPNPKGVVKEASDPISGSSAAADQGGNQPFGVAAAKMLGGGVVAFLVPPSQSFRVWREEILTCERRGDQSRRQAPPGLKRAATVISSVPTSHVHKPGPLHALCWTPVDFSGRFHTRSPGFTWESLCGH